MLIKTGFVLSRLPSSLLAIALASCQPTAEIQTTPPARSPLAAPTSPTPSAADITQASRYRQEGLSARQQGNFPQAIAALEKSVQLDPTHLSGYVILGWTQHLAGQATAATTTLQTALQRDPNHVPALNALGIVYLVNGQLEQAVATHTQAAQLQPNNEIAYYNLSLAYQRLQQYGRAIETAIKATQLEPENPHPWVALAIAHWSKGDRSSAQTAYTRAIELDSGYGDHAYLSHLKEAGFSPDQIQLTEQVLRAD
uniref:Tetratricopeptide TPR_2 repeat protein n=1 Tax=Cyanothece sp. (strain PCC 7425 / ATCC 29141) TaxID=395961 RepID=B8HN40_CYAP4